MGAGRAGFLKLFRHQWSLEDLLADDMTQSMMRADGVDPNLVRTLFSELKGRGRAGTAHPVKRRLRVFCRHAFNRFLPCKLPSGPDGPCLQGSLLVVSAAVAWLALGRL